ncbi:MAG: hypothetical protein EXS14_06540 [Planctomycetes bacterium]|nr:hypothetical protein [Planctomycetota bacterium]
MLAAHLLEPVLARALRRDARRAALNKAVRSSVRAAPLAALVAAVAVFLELPTAVASGCAGVSLLCIALAAVWRSFQGVDMRRLLHDLDTRCHGAGALMALRCLTVEARFAPLVMAHAAAALQRDPGALRVPRAGLLRLSVWLLLAFVIAWWPQGVASLTAQTRATSAPDGSESAAAHAAAEGRATSGAHPEANLSLALERRVLPQGQDEPLHITFTQLSASDVETPVRFIALFSDGFDGADQGYGRDQRPVRLDAQARLTREGPWASETSSISLRELLRTARVEGSGLVSLEVRAMARLASGADFEVCSAPLTFTLADAGSAVPEEAMVPVTLERQQAATSAGMEQPKLGLGGGGGAVKLGAAEELGKATLVPKAVKPLVSEGNTLDKEVDVYEREAGGVAAPPTPKAQASTAGSSTLLPQTERTGLRAKWNAAELRLIERYFRRLQSGAGIR